ncbi:MAG: S-layer homology domain-containing protein [Chloroflexota bacterium]|nr:S-layer homology domain-containing protein [Chloroflexota bacterium]
MKTGSKKLRWILALTVLFGLLILPNKLLPKPVYATPAGFCTGFTDVDEHYYMCDALKYLANNPSPSAHPPGPAVSGYNCGGEQLCFRPTDNVSRGQFVKMIAVTYSWDYTGSTQDFTDVPPSNVFFPFVEAAYHKGVIGGYTDPQCARAGQVSPCFLPSNPVSRGQIAKMTAQAAGYYDNVGDRFTYADVPSSYTFWADIERLTMHVNNSPYPPDQTQPSCPSSTQPCFYPGANAQRADAVEAIFLVHGISGIGANSRGQVFPHKFGRDGAGNATGWDGVTASVIIPDPGIINDPAHPISWVASPVGLSQLYSGHFVESGWTKDCYTAYGCVGFAYASWDAEDGITYGEVDLRAKPLIVGQSYTFQTVYTSSGRWQPVYCNSSACYSIIPGSQGYTTGDMGTATLPFFSAGGESYYLEQHWGDIQLSSVGARHPGGSWTSPAEGCYDPTIVPWITGYGSISGPCYNGSWTVHY